MVLPTTAYPDTISLIHRKRCRFIFIKFFCILHILSLPITHAEVMRMSEIEIVLLINPFMPIDPMGRYFATMIYEYQGIHLE